MQNFTFLTTRVENNIIKASKNILSTVQNEITRWFL